MNQIGIIGKPSRRRFQIVNQLEGNQNFRVRIFSRYEEVKKFLETEILSGLIFIEEEFLDSHIELMDEVTHQYPELVTLFLATTVTQAQRDEIRRYEIPRCTVLDLNHELKDLRGVVKRMVNGEKVFIRNHFRFAVSKRAQLITQSGPAKKIHIVDISVGGLQARVLTGAAHVGEKIQIKVPRDNGKGSHIIVGQVAWVNTRGAMGVEFDKVISKSASSPLQASA